jgi:hypothetical protein
MTESHVIDAAWSSARAGQWALWPGLPSGLTIAAVTSALGRAWGGGRSIATTTNRCTRGPTADP